MRVTVQERDSGVTAANMRAALASAQLDPRTTRDCELAAYDAATLGRGGTMPRLTAVIPATAEVGVPIGAETITVTYRPAVLTAELQLAIAAAEQSGSINDGLVEPLADLLVRWDLTDDDDTPYPTTPESLRGMALVVLMHVLLAIIDHLRVTIPSAVAVPNGRARR